MSKILKLSAAALCVGLMSGCATVSEEQFKALEGRVSKLEQGVGGAVTTANEAKTIAAEAERKAAASMSAANAAQATADDAAEKINRMMKKAMQK
jgi:murein lipoprotein